MAAIRTAQPRGPYYIAGYCFGAMVAFEMAHQLQRQGEKVAFLGLFMGRDSDVKFGTRIFNRLEQHIEQFQSHGWKNKLHELRKNTATKVQSAFWNVRYTLFKRFATPSSTLFKNIPQMNLQAAKRYMPKLYPGRMTVFLSGVVQPAFDLDPRIDLHGLEATDIDLKIVSGERDTMLREPFVTSLAEQLRTCLQAIRKSE